jgi:hypothetical protein
MQGYGAALTLEFVPASKGPLTIRVPTLLLLNHERFELVEGGIDSKEVCRRIDDMLPSARR